MICVAPITNHPLPLGDEKNKTKQNKTKQNKPKKQEQQQQQENQRETKAQKERKGISYHI